MCDSLEQLSAGLGGLVSSLDAASLSGHEAAALVEAFARMEKLAAAGRAVAVERALETRSWRNQGFRTPAQWLAMSSGSSVTQALDVVTTAGAISELPATRAALVEGRVSTAQAAQIVEAAKIDPSCEATLLESAEVSTYRQLRRQSESAIAAALGDERMEERVHRHRYLRFRSEAGAILIDGRLTRSAAAPLMDLLGKQAGERWHRGARGQRESKAAYMADALVSLIDSEAVTTTVNVLVDKTAFDRGHTIAGEQCEIIGVGPIPVSTAHGLAKAGAIKLLGRDGSDITRVAHLGRTIPAKILSALMARDTTCIVPGCDETLNLEIDHIIPLAQGGTTTLENLGRMCKYHHYLKTYHGFILTGPSGARDFHPPP